MASQKESRAHPFFDFRLSTGRLIGLIGFVLLIASFFFPTFIGTVDYIGPSFRSSIFLSEISKRTLDLKIYQTSITAYEGEAKVFEEFNNMIWFYFLFYVAAFIILFSRHNRAYALFAPCFINPFAIYRLLNPTWLDVIGYMYVADSWETKPVQGFFKITPALGFVFVSIAALVFLISVVFRWKERDGKPRLSSDRTSILVEAKTKEHLENLPAKKTQFVNLGTEIQPHTSIQAHFRSWLV